MIRPWLRQTLAALAIVLGGIQLGAAIEIARKTATVRQMADFRIFHRSAARIVSGAGDPYARVTVEDGTVFSGSANLNPPVALLLMAPLGWLSAGAALAVWTIGSLASAAWAIALVVRELRIRVTAVNIGRILLLLVCAAPTGTVLLFAQISWLLWGPVTWAWQSARHGKWIRAAIVIGALASIKLFLALFVVVFAIGRRSREAAAVIATMIACVAAGVLALGVQPLRDWIAMLRSVYWAEHTFNASIYGVLERLFTARDTGSAWFEAPLTEIPAIVVPLWIVASLTVVAITLRALHRRRDADHVFAATIAAALLVSPLGWIYYLFFLAAPLAALLASDARAIRSAGGMTLAAMIGLGLCLNPLVVTLGQPNGWLTLTLGSVYAWSLVGVWSYTVADTDGVEPRA